MKLGRDFVKKDEYLPHDKLKVVISDAVIDWLVNNFPATIRDEVLDDLIGLFQQPWGEVSTLQ